MEEILAYESQTDDADRAIPPFNIATAARLRNLLTSCFASVAMTSALQLSILVKGARGAGKGSLIEAIADELGFNVITVRQFRHILMLIYC